MNVMVPDPAFACRVTLVILIQDAAPNAFSIRTVLKTEPVSTTNVEIHVQALAVSTPNARLITMLLLAIVCKDILEMLLHPATLFQLVCHS